MIRIILFLLLIAVFFIPVSSYADESKTIVFNKESINSDVYKGLKDYIEQSQSLIQSIENKSVNSQDRASTLLARHYYCATCGLGDCKTCSLTVGGNTGQVACAILHPSCTVGRDACSEPKYDIPCRAGGINAPKPH